MRDLLVSVMSRAPEFPFIDKILEEISPEISQRQSGRMYSQRANAEAMLAVASASFVVSVTTSGPLRAVALATAAVIAATAAAPSRGDIATASFLILLIDICCWRIDFCKIPHSFSPTRGQRPSLQPQRTTLSRRSTPRRATCQPPTDRSAGREGVNW